ncbi:hypothetical protein [uncultured Allobaculum sp.]|uniref:hypothetical protein n=1 Tax=uncultured Allobaculum sp. TaxID=1187017 RepID=UPI0025869978|nr:hypothetical protein [uncultured Allobaculum sp.]
MKNFNDIITRAIENSSCLRPIDVCVQLMDSTYELQKLDKDVQTDLLVGLALAMANNPKSTEDMRQKAKSLLAEAIGTLARL